MIRILSILIRKGLIFLESMIRQKIKKLGITILYGDLWDTDGIYLPDLKIIVLKEGLSELQEEFALLHELVHIEEHSEFVILYNATPTARRKYEKEAVQKSVKQVIEHNEDLICDGVVIDYELMSKKFNIKLGDEEWLEGMIRHSYD